MPPRVVDAAAVALWRRELLGGLGGVNGSPPRPTDDAPSEAFQPIPAQVAHRVPDRARGTAAPDMVTHADPAPTSVALVDLIAALEQLKSAACALQAEASVALDRAERERQAHLGIPVRRRGLGVAAQVGLARRESPHRSSALLGAAKAWTSEMPHTLAALRAGVLSEHRAILLVQETACLEVEDRRAVDALLCADPATLAGVGTRQLVAAARAHAARLDVGAVVRRARRAESERCVTLRPAPDAMTYLTALLPVAQGVAVYAALRRAADAADDPMTGGESATHVAGEASVRVASRRGRGQIMADTLVELVTGQSSASAVPVTVNLVISDAALLGAQHEPGHVPGGGPVPAQVARELVAAGIDAGATWLRRLYADPRGDLVAMTSRARFHPDGLAEFLRIRDHGICRTPYCGAPIRQIDHIVPVAAGGATTAENGEGLCVACNLAKEAPGWARRVVRAAAAPGHAVETSTPTGHRYISRAPTMPGPATPPATAQAVAAASDPAQVGAREGSSAARRERSVVDLCFTALLAEHVDVAA